MIVWRILIYCFYLCALKWTELSHDLKQNKWETKEEKNWNVLFYDKKMKG